MTDTNQNPQVDRQQQGQDQRQQQGRDSLQDQARAEANKNDVDNISPETDIDREQEELQPGTEPQQTNPN